MNSGDPAGIELAVLIVGLVVCFCLGWIAGAQR